MTSTSRIQQSFPKVQVSALNLFNRIDKPQKKQQLSSKKISTRLDEMKLGNVPGHLTERKSSRMLNLHYHFRSSSNSNLNALKLQQQEEPLIFDIETQEGQENLLLLADNKIDVDKIDMSQIANENTKNLINAIKIRKEKNDHSDFYYLLDKVKDKIYMYKSLFMDRVPKYLQDYQKMVMIAMENKQRQQEEDKKRKLLAQIKIKKKKSKYFTPKSKAPFSTMTKKHLTLDQFGPQSKRNSSKLCTITTPNQTTNEIDLVQMLYEKEEQRKEKLYSQKKPKQIVVERISSPKENTTRLLQVQQFEMPLTTRKNDISYLSAMKNSASLPYLQNIKIKETDEDPLQKYLKEREKEIKDKVAGDETLMKKRKRLLLLGKKKFMMINQKAQIKKNFLDNAQVDSKQKFKAVSVQRLNDGTERIYHSVIKLPRLNSKVNLSNSKLEPSSVWQLQSSRDHDFGQFSSILSELKHQQSLERVNKVQAQRDDEQEEDTKEKLQN